MEQLTEEEKLKKFEPFVNRYKEMMLLAFEEGYKGEKGILEYYLTVIKMAEYLKENYDPKDPSKTLGIIPRIHYTFEKA